MPTALFAGGVVNVNGRKLCPRIILMTDGKPTDDEGRETAGVSRKKKQFCIIITDFSPVTHKNCRS